MVQDKHTVNVSRPEDIDLARTWDETGTYVDDAFKYLDGDDIRIVTSTDSYGNPVCEKMPVRQMLLLYTPAQENIRPGMPGEYRKISSLL